MSLRIGSAAERAGRVIALGLLWVTATAVSAQVLTEEFRYADGEINQVSGGLWAIQTEGAALNISAGAAVINQGDLTQGLERVSRALDTPFTSAAQSVVYYAFDATWTALPLTDTGSYFVHLSVSTNSTTFYGRVGANTEGAAPGMFRVSVANANWSQANNVEFPLDLQLNIAYRMVAKYDLNTSQTTLWINPNAESSPSVTATDPPAGAQQSIGAVNLRQGLSNSNSGAPGVIRLENLVVGTAFEQVLVQSPPRIARQPADATVPEGGTATFAVQLENPTSVTAQWRRRGVNLLGETNTTLSYGPVTLADNGVTFDATLSNASGTTNTVAATLTVSADTTPPTLVSVANLDPVTVQLRFSEPLAEPGATRAKNYVFDGQVAVVSAKLGSDSSLVVLTTSPLKLGVSYTIYLDGLTDRSAAANSLAPGTKVSFVASELVPASIGSSSPTDAVLPLADGGYAVTGSGLGSNGAADQFQFAGQQLTGDFDEKVRLENLTLTDTWAQAGLMLRETLAVNSRFAAIFATPSLNGTFFQSRSGTGSAATRAGSAGVNYPDTWLRLRRVGNTVGGYASFDGNVWVQVGSATLTLPSTVYFGLAVASHNAGQATTARFHQLGDAAGGNVVTDLQSPFEPPGPSSRKTCFVISEIMYRNAPRTDGRNLDFIELFNSNPWAEDISGYQLAGDIAYTFPPGTSIAGGGFLVIARSPADLQTSYGLTGVLGPFETSLANAGIIQLLDNGRRPAVFLQVPYLSLPPWTAAAAGTGHSLVLKRPSYGEGFGAAWGVSEKVGGSPGAWDPYVPSALRQVVVNEVLAHPVAAQTGYVELYNHSNQTVDVSDGWLTDFPGIHRFRIPPETSIPARGFVSFDEGQLGFTLSPTGGSLSFESPDGQQILDVVPYEAQELGVALGRVPDGGSSFYRLQTPSPAAANGAARVSEIVINELMYQPISGLKDDQYVELYNQGTNATDLSGWEFTDGINFTFPTGTSLPPNGYVVVARNVARLLTNYPALSPAQVLGNFSGSLSGRGERLALAQPKPFVSLGKKGQRVTNLVAVVVDEVTYQTGGRWGQWSDGGGSSLELRDPRADHRAAANWGDSDESQKAAWTTVDATSRLDLGATQGGSPIDRLEVQMEGEGECLLDNVEVIESVSGTNRLSVANSTFESGLGGWFAQGDHVQSALDQTGGFAGGQCLHVHATDRGDTMINHLRVPLLKALASGQTVTLRAKARWLRGFPEMLLRLEGNYAEAIGALKVPTNLGTPGAPNSQFTSNGGPLLAEVIHEPALPADRQPVVVSARVQDPDGLAQISLLYRVDPGSTYTRVAMKDDGTGGDGVAGDGIYSGTIPGLPAGSLVAFYVTATDHAVSPATVTFPSDAPSRECLVRFGEPAPASAFGTYHYWITQSTANRWTSLHAVSNERHDGTFVANHGRVIYNVRGKFAGSPYHQGFGSPLSNNCHYSLEMPGDDQFLGATSFNKIHAPGNGPWEDDTLQREQTAYWMVRSLGLPWNHRRYVNFFINGNRRQPAGLMEDTQTPSSDVVDEHFPDDNDGHLYKLQPWFEFADDGQTFDNQSWCTLNKYLSGGQKKLARYRPNFLARGAHGTASDYTDVFQLVDTANLAAANSTQKANYIAAMDALVDTEEWLRTTAVEHAVGNWDSFLNNNGQNMYAYKPTMSGWTLFIWDFNIVLGLGNYSDGPTGDDLFKTTSNDTGAMKQFMGTPVYRRMMWRAYEELANEAMNNAKVDPLIDAKYAAFRAENVAASSPAALKSWIRSRHTYLLSRLQTVATTFAITSSGGTDFETDQNPVSLIGTAPITVQDIEINGVTYPVTWTDVRHWQLNLPLAGSTNALVVRGLDRHGKPVPGDEVRLTVTYTGTVEPLARVVLNEIMYHPAVLNAEFIEIYNSATNTSYDLSEWRLEGVGYQFPAGVTLAPGSFWVLAKDRSAFASAYGSGIAVADIFSGFPQTVNPALRLVKPGVTPTDDAFVNGVQFRRTAPWPPAADGTGASLQLIDPTQDNARVANWAASGPPATELATPGRTNAFLKNLAAFPTLWLNEVLAENTTNLVDNFGEHEPFIEIYNGGNQPVDLSSCFLTDRYNNLKAWPFPSGTVLDSGKFLVVWADGQPEQSASGAPHASFRLAPQNGSVALTRGLDPLGVAEVMDYLDYTLLSPGQSFGSYPDGQSLDRRRFWSVTPGASNDPALGPAPVWINEWMAANMHTLTNEVSGLADDWFELYNAGATPVDLGGFRLSSPISDPAKFTIPAGTIVAPHGFLFVWADKNPAANAPGAPLHVDFRLSKDGEEIGLFFPDGSLVDHVSFGAQTADVSEGRVPDGSEGPFGPFQFPTPGHENVPLALQAQYDPSAETLRLEWPTQPGLRYRLVFCETAGAPWESLTHEVATGRVGEWTDRTVGQTERYYRVYVELPE